MRMLLNVRMAVGAGNRALKDGTIARLLETTFAELKPEYAFFYAQEGKRSMNFVFDLKDTADIPHAVERFFVELEAEVEMHPVMNLDDLKKGLGKLKT